MRHATALLLSTLIAASSLAICPPIHASDGVTVAKVRAKASLDLLQLGRERDRTEAEIAKAKAAAAVSLHKICADREHADCMTDLGAAIERAGKEKAALFVWVGMTCDTTVRAAFPAAVHVHLAEMNGSDAPRVVIQRAADKATYRLMKGELGMPVVQPVRDWIAAPKTTSRAAPTPQRFVSASVNC